MLVASSDLNEIIFSLLFKMPTSYTEPPTLLWHQVQTKTTHLNKLEIILERVAGKCNPVDQMSASPAWEVAVSKFAFLMETPVLQRWCPL